MYHRLQRSANTLKDYSKGQKICYHFGNKYYIKKIKIKKKKRGGGVFCHVKHEWTKAWLHLEETHLTYKSVQLPSEPPLVDAAIQLEELRDGPHREDALKNALES